MSTGGPDLFVICKSCGSEVSPYITECPYCGNRLRKRAPKLDRHGRVAERISRRPPSPSLTRLRRGEIPGIRADSHPYGTIVLVLAGFVGCLIVHTAAVDPSQLWVFGAVGHQWWRILTAPFLYDNVGYAFICLTVIALYGTLLERRHGMVLVLALFLLGGAGGMALAAQATTRIAMGGNGLALALLTAWAMQDLRELRAGREIDGDLLGTAVLAVAVALMPLAVITSSWVCDGAGLVAGVLVGFPIARIHPA